MSLGSHKRTAGTLAAICALVSIASAGRFQNGFVHDDLAMLASGFLDDPSHLADVFTSHTLIAHGKSATLPMDTYRPVSLLTFFWDAWLSGKDPWSYHLTNLLLHLGAVCGVFALIRALLPNAAPWALVSATLLFGLSPQLVEAHVWINGRSDPLATLFGLCALLCYERAERSEGKERFMLAAFSGMFVLLGLLSKEVLLFLLPCFLLRPLRGASWKRTVQHLLPIAISAIAYLGLRVSALSGLRPARDREQLVVALHNLPILWLDGLREGVAPSELYLRNMRDDYAALSGSMYFAVLVGTCGLGLATLFVRKRFPVLTWSLVSFAASLSPVALISAILWPGFGRFLYLPLAVLSPGIAEGLDALRTRVPFAATGTRVVWLERVLWGLSAAYFSFFTFALAMYTRDYRDEHALYAAVLRERPDSANGHARMAAYLAREQKIDEALTEYRKAMELDSQEASYPLQAIYVAITARRFAVADELAGRAVERLPARYEPVFLSLRARVRKERAAAEGR